MALTFRVRKRSNPRTLARRIVEAVANGGTTFGIAYADDYRRLDVGADHALHAIDALVRAELPAVHRGRHHGPSGERVWVWSLGEPEGVTVWPRRPVEGVALFPEHERGSREVQWRATPPGPSKRTSLTD